MLKQKDPQEEFFLRISKKLGPNTNLAQVIIDLLSISQSTAYNLIKGKTRLQVHQYRILKKKFDISLENFYLGDPTKQSLFDIIHLPVDDMEVYVKNTQYMYRMLREEAKQANVSWGAMANHIPIFHILGFPELALLRMYERCKHEADKKPSFETFKESIPVQTINENHLKIFKLLKEMDSTEVMLGSALQYYNYLILEVFHAGGFAQRETAIRLLDQTCDMIRQIKNWAARGIKDGEGKYRLHFSKLQIQQNVMLLFKNGVPSHICEMTMGDYLLLNASEMLCKENADILNSLTRKNACMCGVGESKRNEMFNMAILEITDTKDMLH